MDVYHKGERLIQHLTGEEEEADANGRIINDYVIRGAINFIEQRRIAVVSSLDEEGRVWVSFIIGDAGLVTVPHATQVSLNRKLIRSSVTDIFYRNVAMNKDIGCLFIELGTRGRFRVNGTATITDISIDIAIKEAYPNCPKYIQRRAVTLHEQDTVDNSVVTETNALDASNKKWVASADTMFVGSVGGSGRMDASHRGGASGFVEVLDAHRLLIPDYPGNGMFNTLGNFVENPSAGLLFIDFKQRSTLQLTGKALLEFDHETPEELVSTGGTGRYWMFTVEHVILTEHQHDADWKFMDFSPYNPTGNEP